MYIGIFLLASIVISYALGIYYSTFRLSNFLYIYLLFYTLMHLAKFLFSSKLVERLFEFTADNTTKLAVIVRKHPVIFIVLVSFLFGLLSKNYYLGGDDTKLFYLYPQKYLSNFAKSVSPGNTVSDLVGFIPQRSVYYFALTLTIFKNLAPFVNLQSFLYTANILFGLYFFYELLGLTVPVKSSYSKKIFLVASLAYVFSMFNIYTLFNSRLIAIFLISIFPWSILTFVKAVRYNKIHYSVAISIIWTIFCIVSAASLWFLATIILVLPLILFLVHANWKSAAKNIFVIAVSLILFNIHWLYYLPYTTMFAGRDVVSNNLNSKEFLKASLSGFINNSEQNELFYPLNNMFHFLIQHNFGWPYLPIFEKWSVNIVPLSSIFLITILLGLLFKKRDRLGKLQMFSVLSLLLSLYFFTINLGNTKLGNWGIGLFVLFTEKIPGFVAFRNSYDKFGFGLAFNYAFSLGVSLVVVSSVLNKKMLNILVSLSALAAVLIALPFFVGAYRNLPIWKTSNSFYTTEALNKDYINMTDFISKSDTVGRYLTLPLTLGNIAFIQDEKLSNHYYVGVSPLLILSGKNDYSGALSTGVFQQEFGDFLRKGDIHGIAGILQTLNTEYVITNNTISEDLRWSYLLRDGIYDSQSVSKIEPLLGSKVADFGSSYSIYKINPSYSSSKIYIAKADGSRIGVSDIKKFNDSEYNFSADFLEPGDKIVFSDPYFKSWQLNTSSDLETSTNIKNDNFANSWEIKRITPSQGKYRFEVVFLPYKKLPLLSTISNLAMVVGLFYVGFVSLQEQRRFKEKIL